MDVRPPRSFRRSKLRLLAGAVLALLAGGGPRAAQVFYARVPTDSTHRGGELSPRNSGALEAKIQALSSSDPHPSTGFPPIVITDVEANSYLKTHGREFLPRGIYDPELHFHAGRISGRLDMDFNELNQSAPKGDDWGAKALASILKGRQRVSADGRVESANGRGKITIQNVRIGTVEVPDWLVAYLLQDYFGRRFNVDLTKPLTLPDHVARIELATGRATFYRSPNKN